MIVGHFRYDNEGGDRRLHDACEVRHHAEQNDRSDRRRREQMRDIRSQSGAYGERRREDAARNATDSRERRRQELEQAEIATERRAAFERRLHLGIAGAIDGVAGGDAAKRDGQTAGDRGA